MNIIKFGGSSISNSKNIRKVINIVKDYDDQTIVVLSAFGKTTDNILYCGKLASEKNKDYLQEFKKIESFHYDIIRSSVDINFQVKILTKVQQILLDLESILNGIFSPNTFAPGFLVVNSSLALYALTTGTKSRPRSPQWKNLSQRTPSQVLKSWNHRSPSNSPDSSYRLRSITKPSDPVSGLCGECGIQLGRRKTSPSFILIS